VSIVRDVNNKRNEHKAVICERSWWTAAVPDKWLDDAAPTLSADRAFVLYSSAKCPVRVHRRTPSEQQPIKWHSLLCPAIPTRSSKRRRIE
jgi:hypothetical protein